MLEEAFVEKARPSQSRHLIDKARGQALGHSRPSVWLLEWVVKGEVGIFGEDLGTKVLISVGPRCLAVDDMEEENFEAKGVEQ